MLLDVCQLYILQKQIGSSDHHRTNLYDEVREVTLIGLKSFVQSHDLDRPSDERIPFRELGLALGLRAVERMLAEESELPNSGPSHSSPSAIQLPPLKGLLAFLPLADRIESCWLDPEHQSTRSWSDHLDMNEIMLASALNPSCWLQ